MLILDEPTANLDFESRENIWYVITNIVKKNSNKLSVLVSTQHIEEAERLSDRILIIDDGKDKYCDSPANIKNCKGTDMRILCQINQENFKDNRDEESE